MGLMPFTVKSALTTAAVANTDGLVRGEPTSDVPRHARGSLGHYPLQTTNLLRLITDPLTNCDS